MFQEWTDSTAHWDDSDLRLLAIWATLSGDADLSLLPQDLLRCQAAKFRNAKPRVEQSPHDHSFLWRIAGIRQPVGIVGCKRFSDILIAHSVWPRATVQSRFGCEDDMVSQSGPSVNQQSPAVSNLSIPLMSWIYAEGDIHSRQCSYNRCPLGHDVQ